MKYELMYFSEANRVIYFLKLIIYVYNEFPQNRFVIPGFFFLFCFLLFFFSESKCLFLDP